MFSIPAATTATTKVLGFAPGECVLVDGQRMFFSYWLDANTAKVWRGRELISVIRDDIDKAFA